MEWKNSVCDVEYNFFGCFLEYAEKILLKSSSSTLFFLSHWDVFV